MALVDVDAKGAAKTLVDEESASLAQQLAILEPVVQRIADRMVSDLLDGLDKRLRAILSDAAKGLNAAKQ